MNKKLLFFLNRSLTVEEGQGDFTQHCTHTGSLKWKIKTGIKYNNKVQDTTHRIKKNTIKDQALYSGIHSSNRKIIQNEVKVKKEPFWHSGSKCSSDILLFCGLLSTDRWRRVPTDGWCSDLLALAPADSPARFTPVSCYRNLKVQAEILFFLVQLWIDCAWNHRELKVVFPFCCV